MLLRHVPASGNHLFMMVSFEKPTVRLLLCHDTVALTWLPELSVRSDRLRSFHSLMLSFRLRPRCPCWCLFGFTTGSLILLSAFPCHVGSDRVLAEGLTDDHRRFLFVTVRDPCPLLGSNRCWPCVHYPTLARSCFPLRPSTLPSGLPPSMHVRRLATLSSSFPGRPLLTVRGYFDEVPVRHVTRLDVISLVTRLIIRFRRLTWWGRVIIDLPIPTPNYPISKEGLTTLLIP
ncbi:hypothetical protein R1flu_001616 [Riccia fluitans]|uniref:Uncharacterized protein n=1 Tax=Riccia fluitans TaxID=41844 RepID=A0ABD1Y3S7_9MARC